MRPRKLRRCRWIPPGRDPPPRPRRAPGTRAWRNCRKTEGRGECRTLGVGCVAVRELVTSAAASPRLELAREWLRERGPAGRALVVGATQEAAADAVRTAAAGAAFGWQRFTLGRLAAAVAAEAMSARGLSPLSPLGVEAVCARVVHQLRGRLGKLDAVAAQPGLPRALSRTIQELRLAGARPAGDLGRVLDAYEAELRQAGLADRSGARRSAAFPSTGWRSCSARQGNTVRFSRRRSRARAFPRISPRARSSPIPPAGPSSRCSLAPPTAFPPAGSRNT